MNNGWEKAKRNFADAIKVAPAERERFLDEVCDGDTDTHRRVESRSPFRLSCRFSVAFFVTKKGDAETNL